MSSATGSACLFRLRRDLLARDLDRGGMPPDERGHPSAVLVVDILHRRIETASVSSPCLLQCADAIALGRFGFSMPHEMYPLNAFPPSFKSWAAVFAAVEIDGYSLPL